MTASVTTARKIRDATAAVFGESEISQAVSGACERFERELDNIERGRGIAALLIAIVGAKGQGKTWIARQFVKDSRTRSLLRSGDLHEDATTKLVWVGPVAPDSLDSSEEIYHPAQTDHLVELGCPYVLLDTPGITDADSRAAELAMEALSLAPVKILVIARDHLRSAANLVIAKQIDGAYCIPVITSVDQNELPENSDIPSATEAQALAADVRALKDNLQMMSPNSHLLQEVLVPDFEITGDEAAAGQLAIGKILDRLSEVGITNLTVHDGQSIRINAAARRLHQQVGDLISAELPSLSGAVSNLHRETEQLPRRVLASLLGSEEVLETGVRMRLRARLASDTSLIWFPYRTLLSVLNVTQGAWDRVMLALSGSVPSFFGALTSWAQNSKRSREFESDVASGIRKRMQQQIEERLRPLGEQFYWAVRRLQPKDSRTAEVFDPGVMRLNGVEELQLRSQKIFDRNIEENVTSRWRAQLYAFFGTILFWVLMAGPIVVTYRQYFESTWRTFIGEETTLAEFPNPTAGLYITSLLLSLLPLAIYCMLILTFTLSHRRLTRITKKISQEHDETIEQLEKENVISLYFQDDLLQQAEYLISLRKTD